MLNVTSDAFLIVITDREQVASIQQKHPVYVVTNIAIIPLSGQKNAAAAIGKARALKKAPAEAQDAGSETEDDEMELETDGENPVVDPEVQEEIEQAGKKAVGEGEGKGSVTEDVLKKKGAYGRFTSRWFSKRGWAVDQRRAEGLSVDPPPAKKIDEVTLEDKPENQPAPPTSDGDVVDLSTEKDEEKKDDKGGADRDQEDTAKDLTPGYPTTV